MINRTLFLKELINKTIKPAFLVVDEKLNVQYHSPNITYFAKLPKIFSKLKQLESLNKIAFTDIAKKAIQSINFNTNAIISENLVLKNKNYSIELKIQKLQAKLLKEPLYAISFLKYTSPKLSLNHFQNKAKSVKFLEDELNTALSKLDLLKKENISLRKSNRTIQKKLNTLKKDHKISIGNQIKSYQTKITSERKTTEALKKSEIELVNQKLSVSLKNFKDTFNNSANFIGRINLKGQLVKHNLTVYNKLADKKVPYTNIYIWNFPWCKNLKETQKQLRQDFKLAKNGQSIKSQVAYTLSPNFVGTLEYTFKPLRNEKGEITEILVEGYDVTEQVNTLKKLKFNEQKFKAIFNHSSNFIGIFNLKGIILDLNKTITNNFNNKETIILGIPLSNFHWFAKHKSAQLAIKKWIKQAAKGKKAQGIINYTIPNQLTGTMQFAITPIFDETGKVAWLLGEGKDISTIINAQRELSYKEQKFRAIFNNSSNLIGLYNTKGYIEELNQPFLNKIGKSRFIGTLSKLKIWEIPWIENYKESQQAFKRGFKKALNSKVDKGIIQYSPGAYKIGIFEYTISPIFDEDNKVIKVLCEGKDITEKIEVQKEIQASEKKFKALFFNAENIVVRLSPKGRVLAHNKIVKSKKNYNKLKENIGQFLWNLPELAYDKASKEKLKKDIKIAANGKLVSGIVSSRKNENQQIQLAYSFKPVFGTYDKKIEWILCEAKDITELNEAKNKYKKLFENNIVGIVILNDSLKQVECNNAYEKITGYSFNEIKLTDYYSLIDKNEIIEAKLNEQKIRTSKVKSLQFKRTLTRKNGKKIIVNIYLKPTYINNKFSNAIVTIADITELESKRKALKQSEQLYKAVFDGVNDGLYVYNFKNDKIITINEQLLKIAKCKNKTQFFNKANNQFIPYLKGKNALKINWIKKIVKNLETQILVKQDFCFELEKGASLNLSTSTIKLNDSLLLAAVNDITATKKAQSALQESEIRYRSLFENNVTGIALGNKFGQILQVNKALCTMFGYSKKEMLQLNHQDLAVQGKNDQSYIFFKALVEGHRKKFSTTKQFVKKNGDYFYAIIFVSGIYDKKNNFKYNITSISDISELKNLERKLKEKQIELASKVVELEKYIESNLELENFAFIASHDLKSPTRTIINYSNLLIENAEKKLNEVELQFLKFIIEGSKRLQTTISDLLNFSLANNNSVNIKRVNLNTLLKNIIKDLNSTIVETNATIKIEGLPRYNYVDESLYKQLFLNLINNSLKFHSKKVKPLVKIICQKTSTNYLFSVEDNGIGIPKKAQQKIFGIFKRLHNYSEFEGTGIGLALCKKVVEKHNGKIWVESKKGKGSTFYFTLPFKL